MPRRRALDPAAQRQRHRCRASLRGLGRLRLAETAPAIARLLADPSGGVRVNAIDALLRVGRPGSAAALSRALADERWYVRQLAARACGALSVPSARRALERLASSDARKAARHAATRALQRTEPGK